MNNEKGITNKQNNILTFETCYIRALLSEIDIQHLLECQTRFFDFKDLIVGLSPNVEKRKTHNEKQITKNE